MPDILAFLLFFPGFAAVLWALTFLDRPTKAEKLEADYQEVVRMISE